MTALSAGSSIEWEAAQWVSRRMGDQPFDQDGFDTWLAGDPRRKALFDAMWSRVMSSTMDETLDAVVRQRRSKRTLVAGSVVAVLAVLGGYQALPAIELSLSQPQEYRAADGGMREITLEDGTRLTLAAGAEVRVRYSRHTRAVELRQGTLFAHVSHDKNRPFRIDAGAARITDLGTSFEVSSKPSFVRVTVEEGAVRFGDHRWFSRQLDLTAHQAAILANADLNRVESGSGDGVARWRSEWVEYQDAPLSQVVADLESLSPLPIRIAAGGLAQSRVTGRIRFIDPLRQINNLSILHHFSVEQRDGAVILSDRPQQK